MVIFLLTLTVCLLIYLVTRPTTNNEKSVQQQNIFRNHSMRQELSYPADISDSQQVILSHMVLAMKLKCLPEQVRNEFYKDISKYTVDDLLKLRATFMVTKIQEAKEFGIPAKNTPSGLMERWVAEYLAENWWKIN